MKLTDSDGKEFAFDEKFAKRLYKELEPILLYSIPYEDKKGHSVTIKFNIAKSYMPLIGKLKEILPAGWYKSISQMYRTIFGLGLKTYQLIIQDYGQHDGTKLAEYIKRFNMLSDVMKEIDEAEFQEMYDEVMERKHRKFSQSPSKVLTFKGLKYNE